MSTYIVTRTRKEQITVSIDHADGMAAIDTAATITNPDLWVLMQENYTTKEVVEPGQTQSFSRITTRSAGKGSYATDEEEDRLEPQDDRS